MSGGKSSNIVGELRLTDTNSADDSKGRTWGLDGNLFWYVLTGAFAFVATSLFLFSAVQAPFWPSFSMASLPLALSLAYVFGFRQGKPPAYDLDIIDHWVNGSGFGPRPRLHPSRSQRKNDVAD
jgi:hypothetical protein